MIKKTNIEHPQAHLKSLKQASCVNLIDGTAKPLVLTYWHVCTPVKSNNIVHVCESVDRVKL